MPTDNTETMWIHNAHEGSIWPLGFGPRFGEIRLVASSGNPRNPGIALWDAKSGDAKWRNVGTGGDGAFQIAMAPTRQGIHVAVATERGIVLLGDTTGEPRVDRRLGEETTWGVAAGFLSTGQSFVVGATASGTISRWSAETGALIGAPMSGHSSSVKAIDVLHQTGKPEVVLSGDEKGIVCTWNADTGERVGKLDVGNGVELISAVINGRLSSLFACADFESNVRVWDIQTGRQVGRTISVGGYPTGLTLFESGKSLHIVTANDDAVVSRWNVETGVRLDELPSGFSVAGGSTGAGTTALAVGTVDGSICVIPV